MATLKANGNWGIDIILTYLRCVDICKLMFRMLLYISSLGLMERPYPTKCLTKLNVGHEETGDKYRRIWSIFEAKCAYRVVWIMCIRNEVLEILWLLSAAISSTGPLKESDRTYYLLNQPNKRVFFFSFSPNSPEELRNKRKRDSWEILWIWVFLWNFTFFKAVCSRRKTTLRLWLYIYI